MNEKWGTYLSSVTWEDVEWFKEQMDKLGKADAETKKAFWIRVGLYDENGNVAEPYKGLFEETE